MRCLPAYSGLVVNSIQAVCLGTARRCLLVALPQILWKSCGSSIWRVTTPLVAFYAEAVRNGYRTLALHHLIDHAGRNTQDAGQSRLRAHDVASLFDEGFL